MRNLTQMEKRVIADDLHDMNHTERLKKFNEYSHHRQIEMESRIARKTKEGEKLTRELSNIARETERQKQLEIDRAEEEKEEFREIVNLLNHGFSVEALEYLKEYFEDNEAPCSRYQELIQKRDKENTLDKILLNCELYSIVLSILTHLPAINEEDQNLIDLHMEYILSTANSLKAKISTFFERESKPLVLSPTVAEKKEIFEQYSQISFPIENLVEFGLKDSGGG